MPIQSKAQQRFMFANQDDTGAIGRVARDFINQTPKSVYKDLPDRVTSVGPMSRPDYRTRILAKLANQKGNIT